MPPKGKDPSPPPEISQETEEAALVRGPGGVLVSNETARLIGGVSPDPVKSGLRERSAKISRDPKMVTMRSSLDDGALRPSTEGGIAPQTPVVVTAPAAPWLRPRTGRSEGTEVHDRLARRLAQEAASRSSGELFFGASPGSQPSQRSGRAGQQGASPAAPTASPLPRRPGTAHEESAAAASSPGHDASASNLEQGFRRSLRRLMVDMELAGDPDIGETAHRLRCGQLDKMHQWFEDHRHKEIERETVQPPYLRFSKDDYVMVGSLRVEPHERLFAPLPWTRPSQKPAWMSHSSSSPVLVRRRASAQLPTVASVVAQSPTNYR